MFEQYRAKNWRIKAISWFSSQRFAFQYTLLSAIHLLRPDPPKTAKQVKNRLKRAHKLWVNRLSELVTRGLWLPTPSYNADMVKHATIKRCMYCRPTNAVFHTDETQPALKLCGRRNICPFCYSRQSEEYYRRVSFALRQFQKLRIPVKVVYRSETYFVSARAFENHDWQAENIIDHADELRGLLRQEQKAFAEKLKPLKKHTLGVLWRVVVNPVDIGWEIQLRHFFLTWPKAQRPVKRAKKSAAIFLQSANAADFKEVRRLLGYFVAYPSGLLLSYAELAAVALRARDGLKLSCGTGCLYAKARKRKPPDPPNSLPFLP